MKNVRLIEVTLDELGELEPRPGIDVIYQGETDRVVEVTPPCREAPIEVAASAETRHAEVATAGRTSLDSIIGDAQSRFSRTMSLPLDRS